VGLKSSCKAVYKFVTLPYHWLVLWKWNNLFFRFYRKWVNRSRTSLEPQLPKAYNLGNLTPIKNPEAPNSESW